MAGYICLLKYTQQGLAEIKTLSERFAESKDSLETMGIRPVGIWWTMGEYDMVAVLDAPDDATMATWLMALGRRNIASAQTMRALSEDEFAEVVARLP